MMQVMKDIGGVEMPDYFARLTPEARSEATNGETPESVATVERKAK
jgi:hypothetical protein